MTEIIKINPEKPESKYILQAAKILQNGGVIAYPTETVYGIGCNVFNTQAVNRIYDLKNRDRSKALILIAADVIQITDLVETIPPVAERLIENFWPGPLTIVFKASARHKDFAFHKSKTIAVRIPDSKICLSLLTVCGFPLVSTSANKSGEPAATDAQGVTTVFNEQLDAMIDGGPAPSTMPSTVVDITRSPARIVRSGAISALEIKTILDVTAE